MPSHRVSEVSQSRIQRQVSWTETRRKLDQLNQRVSLAVFSLWALLATFSVGAGMVLGGAAGIASVALSSALAWKVSRDALSYQQREMRSSLRNLRKWIPPQTSRMKRSQREELSSSSCILVPAHPEQGVSEGDSEGAVMLRRLKHEIDHPPVWNPVTHDAMEWLKNPVGGDEEILDQTLSACDGGSYLATNIDTIFEIGEIPEPEILAVLEGSALFERESSEVQITRLPTDVIFQGYYSIYRREVPLVCIYGDPQSALRRVQENKFDGFLESLCLRSTLYRSLMKMQEQPMPEEGGVFLPVIIFRDEKQKGYSFIPSYRIDLFITSKNEAIRKFFDFARFRRRKSVVIHPDCLEKMTAGEMIKQFKEQPGGFQVILSPPREAFPEYMKHFLPLSYRAGSVSQLI